MSSQNINIQIFGVKNSSDTRKAERFFRERRVPFHFRDLNEKGVSSGELENIKQSVPLEELIDKEGKQFRKRNLSFMVYDTEKELLEDPLLFKTPIVRKGRIATVGYQPDVWKEWIK
jgi:arsenate reductase (glutaredoxin)